MFIYTGMKPNGTALMMLLGLPFIAASLLLGLSLQAHFSAAYLVALASAPLMWSVAYTNSLRWFNSLVPARPAWQFVCGVLAVESFVVGLQIHAMA